MKRLIIKSFRFLLYSVIALVITANLVILLSGRFYLYKGLASTYFAGKSGPTIYDKDLFSYSTIKGAPETETAILHHDFNKFGLTKEQRAFVEGLDTKALLVYHKDSLLFEEYWGEHDELMVSNSFSVAKTVVALLISIAIEEGKIEGLDEPVSHYIPEFKTNGREAITIRHLLAMASGLDWEESGKNPFSDNAESYYGTDLYGHVTRQLPERTPGEHFNYQSGNSQLLGFVVERATGVSLSEYTEEKIWSKIGASHDLYWSLDKEGGDEKAFCCMYATARDYGKLGTLILNKGKYNGIQVFPLWFYHEMVSPSGLDTDDGIENSRYGMHIWTYMDSNGPVNYCRGILGQYLITIPNEELLIVRIGSKRIDNFRIPEEFSNDHDYIDKNRHKVGHCLGLFEYIAIGKSLKSKAD